MKFKYLIMLFIFGLLLAACGGDNSEAVTAVVDQPLTSAEGKLNMNTAGGDDFQEAIPDFSDRMVREFAEYRPYISIQQFRREIGKYVSDEQVAEYEQYIYVPVDINNSDAETIMQIPGVDSTVAEALLAARPYTNSEAFLNKISELAPAVDAAVAASYLDQ